MEDEIKSLISDAIKDLNLRVSSVYDSNEEGVKTRNIGYCKFFNEFKGC